MFDDDIEIDFDEILNCSQPSSQPSSPSLKRENTEVFQEQTFKKHKTEDMKSLQSHIQTVVTMEPEKRFNFRKTSNTVVPVNGQITPSTSKNILIHRINSQICRNEQTKIRNSGINISGILNDKISTSSLRRRFPGPAGLLPVRNTSSFLLDNTEKFEYSNIKEEDLCSQTTFISFDEELWGKMMNDFRPTLPATVHLPDKYDIQWIKSHVKCKKLINQKSPFLAGFIVSIGSPSIQTPVVSLTMQDKTGTIQGSMVHTLLQEYSDDLVLGSVIVLKEIGVLSMESSGPCITITKNNLISIYTKKKQTENNISQLSSEITKINIQNISADDLIEKINKQKQLERDSYQNIQLMPVIPKNREPFDICDNFRKAVFNANKERNTTRPNLNNPKLKSSSFDCTNDFQKNSREFRSEEIIQKISSNLSQDCKENTNIMNFFDGQDDIDNFFKDEPNFCSTQVSLGENSKDNKQQNSINKTQTSEQVWDIFEGVDANALFDEF